MPWNPAASIPGEDERAFLQRRMGLVSLAFTALVTLAWLASVVQYLILRRTDRILDGSSLAGLASLVRDGTEVAVVKTGDGWRFLRIEDVRTPSR